MTEIQGKSILVRVSARFELVRVRVIGSRLYSVHQSALLTGDPDRFYVISMEFLSLSRRRYSSRNVLSGEERGETNVFAGYFLFHPFFCLFFPYCGNWSQAKSKAGKISWVNYFNRNESENFIPVVKFDSVFNKCE